MRLAECTKLLQEAEKLKHENEELRKLGEDAVLDQQLNKALQETDKLKLAADAYKKELLQQKVSELQAELAQTAKRLKAAEEKNTGDAMISSACVTERHVLQVHGLLGAIVLLCLPSITQACCECCTSTLLGLYLQAIHTPGPGWSSQFLMQTCKSCDTGLSQAVQGGKSGRRDSLRKMDKRGSQASLDGLPNGEAAASTSLQTSTSEREALLVRLQGSEAQKGDVAELLTASAKVLQDAGKSLLKV